MPTQRPRRAVPSSPPWNSAQPSPPTTRDMRRHRHQVQAVVALPSENEPCLHHRRPAHRLGTMAGPHLGALDAQRRLVVAALFTRIVVWLRMHPSLLPCPRRIQKSDGRTSSLCIVNLADSSKTTDSPSRPNTKPPLRRRHLRVHHGPFERLPRLAPPPSLPYFLPAPLFRAVVGGSLH